MDTHAIEVGVGALVIAATSGFGGAYLGAWTTARHDRIERARTRRIEAADDLVTAWADALFAIDAAIRQLEDGLVSPGPDIARAHELVNKAVTLSVRADLLFGAVSLASRNEDDIRDHARQALAAVERGDRAEARRQHGHASMSQAWLVNTAAEAIQSTGTRRDVARRFREVRGVPEADPARRAGNR